MKAIATVEGGGTVNYNAVGDNGASMGAFQWNNGGTPVAPGQTPKNWQNAAQQYLGNANAPMTPANQNYVAYQQILAYKNQGLSPTSVAALWNGAKPDPNNPGQYVNINPEYAQKFQAALAGQNTSTTSAPAPTNYSVGGFLGNVIGSGASFLGNVGSAILHPIQTVENLGSIPVGALQELGGETTPETQVFDQVKDTYAQRYGGLSNIANTIYTDPIGFLADLSTVAGGVAGVAGIAGKAADLAGIASTAADVGEAGETANLVGGAGEIGLPSVGSAAEPTAIVPTVLGSGIQSVQQTLSKVSQLTNPLAPVVAGAGVLAGKIAPLATEAAAQVLGISSTDIDTIMEHPDAFTPKQMATVSRAGLGQEVEGAFDARMSALDEAGAAYAPIRADETPIVVSPTFLDDAFRNSAEVNVKDGQITPTADSLVRDPKDIRAMQQTYNFWKPYFQNGELTPNQFLNFRQDLNTNMARFERDVTPSPALSAIGKKIYTAANTEYRPQVAGLEAADDAFSSQKNELTLLKKGLVDKDGKLLDTAINKIANAANKGNDKTLARLEEVLPGITKRIQVLRTIEHLQDLGGPKVGTYTRSIVQAGRLGGLLYGAATGDVRVLGGALAMDAISNPKFAVPLIRAVAKIRPEAAQAAIASMTRYVVMGASTLNAATTPPSPQQTPAQGQPPQQTDQVPSASPTNAAPQDMPSTNPQQLDTLPQDTTALLQAAQAAGYNPAGVQSALSAGYTPQEIEQYLAQQ